MCEGRPVSPVFFNLQSLSNLQLHGQKRTFIFCKYYAFLLARDFSMGGLHSYTKMSMKSLLLLPKVQNTTRVFLSYPLSGPLLQGGRSVCPSSTITFFQYSKHTAFNERLRGIHYTNGFAQQNQKISNIQLKPFFSPPPLKLFTWEVF